MPLGGPGYGPGEVPVDLTRKGENRVNEKKPPARPALNLRPFDLDLKRELKAWAVLQDTDMANLAERYIREGLARDKKKAKN